MVATGTEAIAVMAAATGYLPTTFDRTARALREQRGAWVQGGRGGGKNSARVRPNHFSNLIRGLAGPLPSDAPEALDKLQHLVMLYRILPSEEDNYSTIEQAFCLNDRNDEVFDRWFERCLISLAGRPWTERNALLENTDVRDAEMVLSPDDARIRIEWGDEFQGPRRALVFGPEVALTPLAKIVDPPRARRRLVLPLTVLVKAANLLTAEDPLPDAGRCGGQTLSNSDAGDTTATPERETPDPHHRDPAPTHNNQPREPHAAGTVHNPDSRRVCVHSQERTGTRGAIPQEVASYDRRPGPH